MSERKRRKRLKFVHILAIVSLLLVLIGLYILAYIWSYLGEYQKSTPKTPVQEIAIRLAKGDYAGAMELGAVDDAEFFDSSQYQSYMKRQLGDMSALTILEVSSRDPETHTYKLLGSERERGVLYTVSQTERRLQYGFFLCKAAQEPIPLMSYTIVAPEGETVLVNGQELPPGAKTERRREVRPYNGLKEQARVPKLAVYQIGGFAVEPAFTLSDEFIFAKTEAELSLLPMVGAEEQAKLESLAAKVAEVYSKFTSRDATWEELTEYLYKNTEFYTRMGAFDNAWFLDHSQVEFRNPSFENMVRYSPECFSTEIRFDYYVRAGRTEKIYPTHYRMSFIREKERYLVANIEIL